MKIRMPGMYMALHLKSKRVLLVTIGVLGLVLIGLVGCAGNVRSNITFPPNEPPQPPPTKITASQLYAEYQADETAADAKYKGVSLWFTELIVEEVSGFQEIRTPTGDLGTLYDNYVMADSVKFRLSNPGITFSIGEGSKVDIVGEVQGLENGILIVEDCWLEIVEGISGVIY